MLDKQCTEIFAAICGSLDDVEQRRSDIEHLHYALIGEDGERTIHIIIFNTPTYKEEEDHDIDY